MSYFQRKGETGFKLFEQMKEWGLNPDIVTYSTVYSSTLLHVEACNYFVWYLLNMKGIWLGEMVWGAIVCFTIKMEVYFCKLELSFDV